MPVSTLLMGSLGGGGGLGQGIANIAGGLISGITGLGQKRKARKLLREAGDQPLYSIPNEILQNQKSAELAAQEGLPSQQYNNAMKNIQRSQASVLAGATDRRSALMALPRIQRQANDAYGDLDAKDAAARMQNQRTLYSVGNTTAGYRDKAYNINQLQPWTRKHNYAQGLLGAGNQNFTGGLEKLAGGVGMLIGGGEGGGGSALMGGMGRRMKVSGAGEPTYYNGYGAGNSYSEFETGY